jgi:outer membrane protein OmpA-like peptidoglycan-associated protein
MHPHGRMSLAIMATTPREGALAALLVAALLPCRRCRQAALNAMARRRVTLLSLALALTVPATAASAPLATSIDVQRFQPAGGAFDILSTLSARTAPKAGFKFQLFGNYADAPLRLTGSGTDRTSYEPVLHQTSFDLAADIGLLDRLEVSVVLPFTLSQGSSGATLDSRFDRPGLQASLADLRIVPKAAIADFGSVHFALGVPFTLPSGNPDAYIGEGTATVNPRLIAEWGERLRLATNVGVIIRRQRDLLGLRVGPALTYAVAGEIPFTLHDQHLAGLLTAVGEVGLDRADSGSMPLEVLGGIRIRGPGGTTFSLGGGPGLTRGYGTPRFRVFASVGFAAVAEPPQTDAPLVIPPPAPEEVPSPPAPEEVPLASAVTAPVETATSMVPPPAPPPPEAEKVKLQDDKIVFLDKINFATAKDTLLDKSAEVLAEVARVLQAHPGIKRVRIEGHTDDQGSADFNMDLSTRRARAVRLFLEKAGVDPGRLESVGYGMTRPITSNATPEGRAANRRVELVVVERAE